MHKLGALRALESELRAIKANCDEAKGKGINPDRVDRGAAHQTLFAIIKFMDVVPSFQGLDFGLVRLLYALANIESGRTEEWLTKPAPNRAPVPVQVAGVRGRCAGVMELLMRAGSDKESAARLVCRCLPDDVAVRLGDARGVTWRTVAGWRDGAVKSLKTDAPTAEGQGYAAMLALAESARIDIRKHAKTVLRTIIQRAG